MKLIDLEENLGLGSENNRSNANHPGDGGFIASFSDGTSFYGVHRIIPENSFDISFDDSE